jgi:hypothetical protein
MTTAARSRPKRAALASGILEDGLKTYLRTRRRVILRLREAGIRSFIVSYPKSGRTWLRLMLGKSLCDHYGLPEQDMLDLKTLSRAAGLEPAQFSHDGSAATLAIPASQLPRDKRAYRGKKVVLLSREPEDVLVSFYFQASRRLKPALRFDGDLSAFIRDDRYGIRKLLTFHNIWYENRTVPKGFLWVRYRDMHEDSAAVLRRVLAFLGADQVPDHIIAGAVAFGEFKNMQRLEASGRFSQAGAMRPRDLRDADSFKVRRGIVGGHRDYLSDADLAFIADAVRELGNPFA